MQVDPSPMNVGDGGAVSRGNDSHTQLLESMVGNPQQTLPPDLRGDVPHSQQNNLRTSSDCKMPGVCSEPSKATSNTSNSNHCSEVPPPQTLNSAPVFGSGALNAPLPDRPKVPDVKGDATGMCHTHHWPCGKTVGAEDLMNLVHPGVTPNKKPPQSAGSAQPVISLPSGFQCSTLFKPGQQVAYVPSPGFTSPLCKITLPPGLGQIAALREATACQFQKDCPSKSSGSSLAPRHKSYPYQFSVGRGVASEKKPLSASKSRTDYASNVKACKAEQKAALPLAASQAMALPVQQAPQAAVPLTHYTISPTAAICCSSALANITQSRLLSLVEKCPQYRAVEKASVAYLKPKTPSSTEEQVALRSPEVRDVPLDLSSKSKRQKGVDDPQSSPSAVTEHGSVTEPHQKSTPASKRLQAPPFSATNTFPVLPENQRNGSTQRAASKLANHSVEAGATWGKGSPQEPVGNLPGTYVGVASPILASTLRSKDGKGASFVEDLQTFAKQEPISIVDQGEQMISRGKKAPHTVKGAPQNKALKHSAGPRSPGAQELAASPLFATANSPSPRKSLGKAGMLGTSSVIKSLWKQSLSQGMAVQKRANHSSPKVKASLNSENLMFQNSELDPANQEEETWETMKSPLSNLESIVKQKTLETAVLTTEHYAHLSGSRKSEGAAFLSRGPNPPAKQNAASGFTPSRVAETSDFRVGGTSPSANDAVAVRRRSADAGSRDKAPKQCDTLQCAKEDLNLSTPKKRSASTNNGGKKDKGAEDLPQHAVPSEAVSQSSAPSGPGAERKVNGAKEEDVSEGAADETKPKKPKRPGKKKNSDLPKATPTPMKKQTDRRSAAGRDRDPAEKKKDPSPPVEKTTARQSAGKGPESGGRRHKGRSSKADREASPLTRAQVDKPSLHRHALEHAPPIAESEPDEDFSPRKKRGRRRTDEALLRDWSFASPPTPPPPPPNPPSSSPPSPLLPPRRPRGRPRLNRQPEGGAKIKTPQGAESKDDSSKKRKRCSSSRYQNGAYEVEKDKVNGEREVKSSAAEEETDVRFRLGATLQSEVPSTDRSPKRSHLNTAHPEDPPTPECEHKPSGKRKFKSKHLGDTEDHNKPKLKQGLVGKRASSLCLEEESPAVKKACSPVSTGPGSTSPSSKKKGAAKSATPEPTPSRPVPPEVRRLIVNKNAGETLLQRAARLGYQEVVLYCLEKDVREVNRRDNAGYTALHEACAHGCTHIVQVLLKHGADVNCSAQDGTRPIHDAVAADNLAAVWMLLNHGADPTLATYSGQTPIKLAQSANMRSFLKEYFSDLEGRVDQDPDLQWNFYSSCLFETDQDACWDFLLSNPEKEEEEEENKGEEEQEGEKDTDCLVFEFSEEPLLPCYHVQVSLSQGFCNWFLLTDVLKRLKVSSRIFRARYPQFEVVSMMRSELWKQVSISQTCVPPSELHPADDEEEAEQEEEAVELVRCVPELQELLGSSIQLLREDGDEEVTEEERTEDGGRFCSR